MNESATLQKVRVELHHTSDGFFLSRDVEQIPSKGDLISVGSDVFVVKQRVWDYAGAKVLKLIVEEPKD